MKAKKALKKINKALDYDIDSVLMLGLESNHEVYHSLVNGEEETIANLILNFFEKEPKIADIVLEESVMKKLNRIVTANKSEGED